MSYLLLSYSKAPEQELFSVPMIIIYIEIICKHTFTVTLNFDRDFVIAMIPPMTFRGVSQGRVLDAFVLF